MPRNLEIKARLENLEKVILTARTCGMKEVGVLNQVDTYFDVPSGRLKLREINQKQTELIYYNRDERSGQRLSDFIIYPTSHPSKLKELLERVHGIRAIVVKKRVLFMHRGSRIHIDVVDRLGPFLEFEVPVGESLEVARHSITGLIDIFGIRDSDLVLTSYLDLILELHNDATEHDVLL